jgi:hypothetical protein
VQRLEAAGYKRRTAPLEVAGIKFDLPNVLMGSRPSTDLIVVADIAFDPEERILRNIQGIARALDVTRSTRPLTAVIAGPRPSPSTMEALTKVCRVLPVGLSEPGDLDASMDNWLAVLLPLKISDTSHEFPDPMAELGSQVGDLNPEIGMLVGEAANGKVAVERGLYIAVNRALLESGEE